MIFSGLLSLALASTAALAAPVQKRADVCNGRAEFCGRKYSEVTFMGAHNSYAVSENPLALSRNQKISVADQLGRGIRLLQAQGHPKDGTVHLCHSSCTLFDSGKAEDFFRTTKTFLDQNINEVITIIVTNPENLSIKDVWDPAFRASGIADLAFVPPALPVAFGDWPTLGELVDTNKRVVIFIDRGADTAAVPYILPEFDMVWETPFSRTSLDGCSVDRISGDLPADQHLYMINHSLNTAINIPFLDPIIVPDISKAGETNSVNSIRTASDQCKALAESGGRAPNFVLLDWVDEGEVQQAGDVLNGF